MRSSLAAWPSSAAFLAGGAYVDRPCRVHAPKGCSMDVEARAAACVSRCC
jgi:hypothetical protein